MDERGYCFPPAVTMMVPLSKLTFVGVGYEVVVAFTALPLVSLAVMFTV